MSNAKQKQRKADREKMIAEANARHDAIYGSNPVIVQYAKHIPGIKDISQKR
jgi:hypothetical protein